MYGCCIKGLVVSSISSGILLSREVCSAAGGCAELDPCHLPPASPAQIQALLLLFLSRCCLFGCTSYESSLHIVHPLPLRYLEGLFLGFWTTWALMQCLCLSTQTINLVNCCAYKPTYVPLTSAFKVWGRSSNGFPSSHVVSIAYALFMFIMIWLLFF